MRLSDADRDRYLKTARGLCAAATASLDARPRIESGLRSSSRRRTAGRRRRLGRWGLALAYGVTFAGSSAVLASALPDTRALIVRLLAQTPGGGPGIGLPADGHGPVLQPPPLFPVLEPAYVPSGLDLRATSYNAGHAAGGRTSRTATLTHGSQANVSPPPVLGGDDGAVLTSRFSSSSVPGYVELIERRATSAPPPTGDEVTVGAIPRWSRIRMG